MIAAARAEMLRRNLEPPKPKPNIYQTSFFQFLTECIYTVDEGRAGEERKWPSGGEWNRIWRDIEFSLLTCSPLLIDKTRRVMASNVMCAFDLWIASGGRDASTPEYPDGRWPSLARSSKNRLVLVQSRKLEDATGSVEFVRKIATMDRILIEHKIYDAWPGYPVWKWNVSTRSALGTGSNGSRIQAIAQGAEQVRGPGCTLLHMEELSFWTEAKATVETALPSLAPDGHLVAVTTPAAATYAASVRRGQLIRRS